MTCQVAVYLPICMIIVKRAAQRQMTFPSAVYALAGLSKGWMSEFRTRQTIIVIIVIILMVIIVLLVMLVIVILITIMIVMMIVIISPAC